MMQIHANEFEATDIGARPNINEATASDSFVVMRLGPLDIYLEENEAAKLVYELGQSLAAIQRQPPSAV